MPYGSARGKHSTLEMLCNDGITPNSRKKHMEKRKKVQCGFSTHAMAHLLALLAAMQMLKSCNINKPQCHGFVSASVSDIHGFNCEFDSNANVSVALPHSCK